ncbi:hypothetical protein FSP39_020230 [Pinctada imbricata]|uniref:Uncharacterized protein n=1 Tax=Pinctada imbricata TaxID=66713 RepID=A0AA88YI01_PINIB|nr:hypothetical protein FSP39_020230 [Pinctada imbricata]
MSVDVMKNYPSKDNKTSLRKSNKPIMEKKRRARINNCLTQLKTLVLESMKKDEKADILEMTVKYLRGIQRQQLSSVIASDPNIVSKYRAGYQECATEVTRYLNSTRNVEPDVKSRLVGHLSECLRTQSTCNGQYRTSPHHQSNIDVATPLSVHIPQNNSNFSPVANSNGLLVASSPQMQQNQTTCQPMLSASPVHNVQQTTNVSGQFQILPARNVYNGPIAIYMGNVNQSNSPSQNSIPVFTLHVPESKDVSPSHVEISKQADNAYPYSGKNTDSVIRARVHYHNERVYNEKLWRPVVTGYNGDTLYYFVI